MFILQSKAFCFKHVLFFSSHFGLYLFILHVFIILIVCFVEMLETCNNAMIYDICCVLFQKDHRDNELHTLKRERRKKKERAAMLMKLNQKLGGFFWNVCKMIQRQMMCANAFQMNGNTEKLVVNRILKCRRRKIVKNFWIAIKNSIFMKVMLKCT